MSRYFQKFETILYSEIDPNIEQVVTNIVHRAAVRDVVINNVAVYYDYTVADGDTPEIIAAKYYGSSQYFWLITIANDIIDPYFDWPLTYDDFQASIIALYGSIPFAQQTIFQYYDAFGNVIDILTYNNLPADERSLISAYDYYFNVNESKRSIKLIDKTYLAQIDSELSSLLSGVS